MIEERILDSRFHPIFPYQDQNKGQDKDPDLEEKIQDDLETMRIGNPISTNSSVAYDKNRWKNTKIGYQSENIEVRKARLSKCWTW